MPLHPRSSLAVLTLVAGLSAAGGCTAPAPVLGTSPAVQLDRATPVGYAVEDTWGAAPVAVVVRAVNDLGAAVPAEPVVADLDGEDREVAFDSTGFGAVRIADAGSHAVDVGGESAAVDAWIASGAPLPLLRAAPAPFAPGEDGGALAARPVSNGVVVRTQTAIWWAERGGASMRVLQADEPLLGLQVADVDVDGTSDAITWTATEVYLLRGRPGGGMAWGTGFSAAGHTVGAVDAGDVSGDNLSDIVIAWQGGDGPGVLDVWEGDGQWGFAPGYPRDLAGVPTGVAVADNTDDGTAQITVSTDLGSFFRYFVLDHQLVPTGPRVSDGMVEPGALVEDFGDTTGDGAAELAFILPSEPRGSQSLMLWNLGGIAPLFQPTHWTWTSVGAFWASHDGDHDGYTDLLTLDDRSKLQIFTWDEAEDYVQRFVADVVEMGPIALNDWSGDRIGDLFVAGDALWWFYDGTSFVREDPELPWGLGGPQLVVATRRATGPVKAWRQDGDGARMLAFEAPDDGSLHLRSLVWRGVGDAVPLGQLGDVNLDAPGAAPLELAMCGKWAFALVTGQIHRVDLAEDTGVITPGPHGPSKAVGMGCGAGPGGAVLALANGSEVATFNADLVELSRTAVAGAVDVALGDIGAGPVARACTTPGCSIAFLDAGAGSGFLAIDPTGATFESAAGIRQLPGSGTYADVIDVDGDGVDEIVTSTPDGLLGVYRSTGVSVAGPELYHHRQVAPAFPTFADADFDGILDVWLTNGLDELSYTTSAPPVEDEPAPTGPTGTGDTGGTTP